MSKVIGSWWYTTTGGHCVGIVKTLDEITNEIKFRIGYGDGLSQPLDEQRILRHGNRFFPEDIK